RGSPLERLLARVRDRDHPQPGGPGRVVRVHHAHPPDADHAEANLGTGLTAIGRQRARDGVCGPHLPPRANRLPRVTIASTVAASTRIEPSATYLTTVWAPIRSRPLEMLPITSAPNSASQTLPLPPNRLVPPITA